MKTEIASSEPTDIAQRILSHFKSGALVEENGIVELEKEVIEW